MLMGTAGRQVGSKQETACPPALETSSLLLPYVWETNKHPAGTAKKKKKKQNVLQTFRKIKVNQIQAD